MFPQINNASGIQAYTPSPNPLPYQYCIIYAPAATTVTVVDKFGVTTSGLSLIAGYHNLNMAAITASTGTIYLCHNGDKPVDVQDFNIRANQQFGL